MFNRLKIYTVHLKPNASDDIERLRFVSEGFNWYAFVFTLLWALYHQMWRFLGLLMLINVAFALLLWQFGGVSAETSGICQFGLQIWCGLLANDFLRAHLRRKGYITYALVSGENEMRAEQRFFDHNVAQLGA